MQGNNFTTQDDRAEVGRPKKSNYCNRVIDFAWAILDRMSPAYNSN
jgi:hypothetical protein